MSPAATLFHALRWQLAAQAERPIRLAARAAMRLRLASGTRVIVRSGRLWLTESGEAGDFFLRAGQSYVVRRGGRVVVECDSDVAADFHLTKNRVSRLR